jgi:hypothetical protein
MSFILSAIKNTIKMGYTALNFFTKYRFIVLSMIMVFSAVAVIELYFGHSPFGPDGQFGFWDGNVWGNENSQRVADAYSFTHIIHGMLFYALLWLVARKLPVRYRFLMALILEGGWELLENSSFIINRYREATIALGYVGDSVLNSVSDVGMMAIGFLIARMSRLWISIALIIALEIGCLFWVRDNLTLNIIMLIHPIESIKVWQSEGH